MPRGYGGLKGGGLGGPPPGSYAAVVSDQEAGDRHLRSLERGATTGQRVAHAIQQFRAGIYDLEDERNVPRYLEALAEAAELEGFEFLEVAPFEALGYLNHIARYLHVESGFVFHLIPPWLGDSLRVEPFLIAQRPATSRHHWEQEPPSTLEQMALEKWTAWNGAVLGCLRHDLRLPTQLEWECAGGGDPLWDGGLGDEDFTAVEVEVHSVVEAEQHGPRAATLVDSESDSSSAELLESSQTHPFELMSSPGEGFSSSDSSTSPAPATAATPAEGEIEHYARLWLYTNVQAGEDRPPTYVDFFLTTLPANSHGILEVHPHMPEWCQGGRAYGLAGVRDNDYVPYRPAKSLPSVEARELLHRVEEGKLREERLRAAAYLGHPGLVGIYPGEHSGRCQLADLAAYGPWVALLGAVEVTRTLALAVKGLAVVNSDAAWAWEKTDRWLNEPRDGTRDTAIEVGERVLSSYSNPNWPLALEALEEPFRGLVAGLEAVGLVHRLMLDEPDLTVLGEIERIAADECTLEDVRQRVRWRLLSLDCEVRD